MLSCVNSVLISFRKKEWLLKLSCRSVSSDHSAGTLQGHMLHQYHSEYLQNHLSLVKLSLLFMQKG